MLDGPKADLAVEDAGKVAAFLGVHHHVLDIRGEFKHLVMQDFVSEYSQGRTPNPCVRCNERVKFGLLRKLAAGLGFPNLATGHYARIEGRPDGHALLRGSDPAKDQAYALYRLDPQELESTVFPLGCLTKWAVRQLALTAGLPVSNKEESQDICFVEGDYCEFLSEMGLEDEQGEMVDTAGRLVGKHQGIHRFTIGQRRNLGLPGGTAPFYVVGIDKDRNRIVLGGKEHLQAVSFDVTDCNWLVDVVEGEFRDCSVKVRYRSSMRPGKFRALHGGRAEVLLTESQEAVTPGQSAVMFCGDRVLGGGIIKEVRTVGSEMREA
jgi:tRNA-specific 2-thiouridylase